MCVRANSVKRKNVNGLVEPTVRQIATRAREPERTEDADEDVDEVRARYSTLDVAAPPERGGKRSNARR